LKSGSVFCGTPFKVHSKPDWPNNDADYARAHILRGFPALLVCQLLGFDIVGLNLGIYHCAVGIGVLRLDGSDRLRIAASARQ
jgi:hypothetical protein